MSNQDKLEQLLELEGYEDDLDSFIQDSLPDILCKGICMYPSCEYTTDVEPEQDDGWCEECGEPTVKSGMMLAEVL